MNNSYKKAIFPPLNEWDGRLVDDVCPNLAPAQTMYENDWFTIKDRGGYFTVEDFVKHVVIMPVIDEDFVLMIRVKRPVLNDCPLEFPAGGFESRESPLEAARRELFEETGVHISNLRRFIPMPPLSVSPNRIPRLAYVYRVDLTEDEYVRRVHFDNEVESIHKFHKSEVPKMMCDGSIYVSVPLALLGMFLASKFQSSNPRSKNFNDYL